MTDVQCPVCGEKDHILTVSIGETVVSRQCMSCGYDGSQQAFITLT